MNYIDYLNKQIDCGRLNWEVAVIKCLEAGMLKVADSYSQKKLPGPALIETELVDLVIRNQNNWNLWIRTMPPARKRRRLNVVSGNIKDLYAYQKELPPTMIAGPSQEFKPPYVPNDWEGELIKLVHADTMKLFLTSGNTALNTRKWGDVHTECVRVLCQHVSGRQCRGSYNGSCAGSYGE